MIKPLTSVLTIPSIVSVPIPQDTKEQKEALRRKVVGRRKVGHGVLIPWSTPVPDFLTYFIPEDTEVCGGVVVVSSLLGLLHSGF